jgi:hypothetical protein
MTKEKISSSVKVSGFFAFLANSGSCGTFGPLCFLVSSYLRYAWERNLPKDGDEEAIFLRMYSLIPKIFSSSNFKRSSSFNPNIPRAASLGGTSASQSCCLSLSNNLLKSRNTWRPLLIVAFNVC